MCWVVLDVEIGRRLAVFATHNDNVTSNKRCASSGGQAVGLMVPVWRTAILSLFEEGEVAVHADAQSVKTQQPSSGATEVAWTAGLHEWRAVARSRKLARSLHALPSSLSLAALDFPHAAYVKRPIDSLR